MSNKIKLLSLFSGIGAFEKALHNADIDYDLVGYCEIDKCASKSYSAMHNVPESMNFGDITKLDEKALPKDIDLVCYGFPCQDISIAGKKKGIIQGETRSGLFFEALRIIKETQPKVAIAENVKNLTSKTFSVQFQIVLDSLVQAGYNNYWKILNAKDFGIPQNRERVFIVSIRQDIDTGCFEFPKPMPLEKRLKDLLEDTVDEKYFLSEKVIKFFRENEQKQIERGNGFRFGVSDGNVTAKAITTRAGGRMDDNFIMQVAQMYPTSGNPQAGRVYDKNGIAPAMDTCTGGNRMPKVIEENTSDVAIGSAATRSPNQIVPVRLGNIYGEDVGTGYAGNVWDKEAISPTLMTMTGGNRQPMVTTSAVEQTEATVNNPLKGKTPYGWHFEQGVYDESGIARAVKAGGGSGNIPKVIEPQERFFKQAFETLDKNDCEVGDTIDAFNERVNKSGCSPTITTRPEGFKTAILPVVADDTEPKIVEDFYKNRPAREYTDTAPTIRAERTGLKVTNNNFRIRKLTPKECFRLQGFDDADFAKAEKYNSNTQLYKQAGNSICVPVAEFLIRQIFPLAEKLKTAERGIVAKHKKLGRLF